VPRFPLQVCWNPCWRIRSRFLEISRFP
jgi:hypothetical protein